MKKFRYIGLMIGLIILIHSNSNAQYYYSSNGYAQDWYMPNYIHTTLYNNYYGYEIAHVNRYTRHGHQNFNVLLHRNGWFVELRFDQRGHIYKTIKHRNHYPLIAHHCTNHCGYHKTYYQTYYPSYNHTTVYIKQHNGYIVDQHHHNSYYTNVYVEKQHKQNSYHGNKSENHQVKYAKHKNNNRGSQQKSIRQPQRTTRQTGNIARNTTVQRNGSGRRDR